MLYYGDDNISKEQCDVCGHNHFKQGNQENTTKRLLYKEVRYLSIGPRLLRLFLTSTIAEQMCWHKEEKWENEGVMVHPGDGKAWKEFNRLNPDFAADPRNVYLGFCSDGCSPFNMGGQSYSNWLVFLVVYILPPALVMCDNNIFLSMLILGPNSPTRSIDIYIQPLVDELNKLWKDGVLTYDKFKKQNFTMKVVLMGTISYYLALSMLSRWSTKEKLGCHVCMEHTKAFQLKEGGKTSFFDDHRRMLPTDHEFQFERDAFKKDTIETDGPPRRLSGQELFDRVSSLEQVTFGTKNKKNIPGFGETHNWKKRSIFWELPYLKDHLVRHHIDVMHLEMNFFKNMRELWRRSMERIKTNGPTYDSDLWYSTSINDQNVHGNNYGLGALGSTRRMFRSSGSSSDQSHSSQSYSSMHPALQRLIEEDIDRISSRILDQFEARLEARFRALEIRAHNREVRVRTRPRRQLLRMTRMMTTLMTRGSFQMSAMIRYLNLVWMFVLTFLV